MRLVLDIGGSSIKTALMSEQLEILQHYKVPTPLGSQKELMDTLQSIIEKEKDIDGVAISLPGQLDALSGNMISGGLLKYNAGTNFYSAFRKISDLKVSIENDGKCAALAELAYGGLKDCQNGVVVILGSGIGGGVIINRELYKGSHFFAGEFSFVINRADLPSNISNWARSASTKAMLGLMAESLGLDAEGFTGEAAFELLKQQDEKAWQGFNRFLDYLVQGLFTLQAMFDPEKILIGGGISNQPLLIETLKKRMAEFQQGLAFASPEVVIERCHFASEANLIGAYYQFDALHGKEK